METVRQRQDGRAPRQTRRPRSSRPDAPALARRTLRVKDRTGGRSGRTVSGAPSNGPQTTNPSGQQTYPPDSWCLKFYPICFLPEHPPLSPLKCKHCRCGGPPQPLSLALGEVSQDPSLSTGLGETCQAEEVRGVCPRAIRTQTRWAAAAPTGPPSGRATEPVAGTCRGHSTAPTRWQGQFLGDVF